MAATNALLAYGGMTQRWREDIRVEPQLREEADMTANRGDQIERRKTGVGDDHDLAIWHPINGTVSFRQMMGELVTADAVAGHLDRVAENFVVEATPAARSQIETGTRNH
jgi:hypothetical protein